MIRRPPRSKRTDTLLPYTTLFRSALMVRQAQHEGLILSLLIPSLSRDEGRGPTQASTIVGLGGPISSRHCEERSDAAIPLRMDRSAPLRGLAMTYEKAIGREEGRERVCEYDKIAGGTIAETKK